jgi:oligopeptide transport system ATP-binding protein
MSDPILRVQNVTKHFPVRRGIIFKREVARVKAVDDVSFDLYPGETLGIVGESGCGKSTLARSIMRLHDVTSGRIEFEGRDITNLSRHDMRPIRRQMMMVFQDPYASLNPRMRVGSIVGEPLEVHGRGSGRQIKASVQSLLERVGLNPEHYNRFPHEFSGGQRQRIGIARALALEPRLIVCDEPVSALDVSVQAQILNLLEDLQEEFQLTYIFIAHDLDVVRHVSDRVYVMYLGKVIETGTKHDLYDHPRHPYAASLLSAVPIADPKKARARRPIVLEGDVPSPLNPPSACRFHPRCPRAQPVCSVDEPQLREFSATHRAACHFPVERWPLERPEDIRRPEGIDAEAVPAGGAE